MNLAKLNFPVHVSFKFQSPVMKMQTVLQDVCASLDCVSVDNLISVMAITNQSVDLMVDCIPVIASFTEQLVFLVYILDWTMTLTVKSTVSFMANKCKTNL
jgi:uncharacterized radical SAM superfamily protein